LKKRRKISADYILNTLLRAGGRVPAEMVTGDKVKYAEIMERLGATMLKLAMAGFRGDELRRLTDEATRQALGNSKNPESRCMWIHCSVIGRLSCPRID
jgi:hypothetical protein